jgi:hypothetical protein
MIVQKTYGGPDDRDVVVTRLQPVGWVVIDITTKEPLTTGGRYSGRTQKLYRNAGIAASVASRARGDFTAAKAFIAYGPMGVGIT